MKINLSKYDVKNIEIDQENNTIEFIADEIECKLSLNEKTFIALIEACSELLDSTE